MPAQSFSEWRRGLKLENKSPVKVRVTRNKDDTDDLLVYKPVFGGKRAIQVGTMKRRQRFRRPAVPIFSNAMENEGVRLLTQDHAPKGYDFQYPCALCSYFVFPNQRAWEGYMGEVVETLVLKRLDPSKVVWKRYCRHCAKFLRVWYRPAQQARGELRVRFQLHKLPREKMVAEINALITHWGEAFKELRKELKSGLEDDHYTKDGVSAVLQKYRQHVNQLLKGNLL